MFSWMEQDSENFRQTQATWVSWIYEAQNAGRIFDIDDPYVVSRAEENRLSWAERSEGSTGGSEYSREEDEPSVVDDVIKPYSEEPRTVVVSAMPSQSSRGWGQFVMKREYYVDYFGFPLPTDSDAEGDQTPGARRIILQPVNDDGTLGPAESRTGNISRRSRNFRLELDAGHAIQADKDHRPVVVFLMTDNRSYLYQLFESTSAYWQRLIDFAVASDSSGGTRQLPKCWVSAEDLRRAMPDIPILNARAHQDG